MKKLKVVLLAFWYPEYLIGLANSLSNRMEVFLMLPSCYEKEYSMTIRDEVKTYFFKQPRQRYPTNLITVYNIIKRINKFKPKIIHIQDSYPWFSFGLPFLKKYKLMMTIHDPIQHKGEKKIRDYFRDFSHRIFSNHFIVHGEKLKEEFTRKYKINKDKVDVIPHGSLESVKNYSEKKFIEKKNTVLFFGRIYEYKGLDYLIRAEPLIREKIPDIRIVIAGKGENFSRYRKLIKNKESFIIYNRYIPNEELPKHYQEASIVVLPYIEASQSGVVPVAYAFKKAVVITNVGSIPEMVDNGKTGIIVPPRNVKKLAEAIIYLLKKDKVRKAMGDNGYRKMKKELSWDEVAKKTIMVYEKCLKNN